MQTNPPFQDPAVAQAFATFPQPERDGLLALRQLIYRTATTTPGVGPLHEKLKWGQPSYLTPQTKSGSTIRLGLPKSGGFAIYTHCQTTIIEDFRNVFPDDFTFEGNRAVHLNTASALPVDKLALLITRALTYHLK